MTRTLNIARRLSVSAQRVPHQRAVVAPAGRDAQGRAAYSHLTFLQLEHETDRLARGLRALGVAPGARMVLPVGVSAVCAVQPGDAGDHRGSQHEPQPARARRPAKDRAGDPRSGRNAGLRVSRDLEPRRPALRT